jgi:hypothetical protein
MRRLGSEQRLAFWTTGYEPDRLRLVEAMARTQLPETDPGHEPPPHIRHIAAELRWRTKDQKTKLHRLAQSGEFEKDVRRELYAI